MIRGLLVMALVLVVGSAATTRLRARQEMTLLAKLPEARAQEYYQTLRRRFRRYQLLRGVAVVALAVIVLAISRARVPKRLRHPAAPATPVGAPP